MEKQKFEDKWKDAFREAEVSPSENVWTNIELGLEKTESGGIKRKLLFYQSLAAASVIFALAVGGFAIYSFRDHASANLQLALQPNVTSQTAETPANASSRNLESQAQSNPILDLAEAQPLDDTRAAKVGAKAIKRKTTSNTNSSISLASAARLGIVDQSVGMEEHSAEVSSQEPTVYTKIENIKAQDNDAQGQLNLANLPSLAMVPGAAFKAPEKQPEEIADPVALMLAKLDQREKEISESKKQKELAKENLWTSIGFAAGSFNSPGSHISATNTNTAIQSNNSIANKEADASGYAYTVGLNMGKKVSERWVIQGGVNYLSQSSDYTAQTAVGSSDFQTFRPQSINELEKLNQGDARAEDAKIVTTAPYNVNNNVRYLSVPIQAGYLLINKKFGLQFNAGVSTDLFINNIKTAEGQNLDQINQGIGDDSPYRAMNFSGLLGTELTYKFSPRYRVAFNPGLRYPLNSVYKSDLGVQSSPLTFDMGLRFRYIFH
jgi:hypothetical protein